MVKYHVTAVEIDEDTGEKKEVLNDSYNGFALYGDKDEKFAEVLMHINLIGLASMLVQGEKSNMALKLADFMGAAKKSFMGDLEDNLLSSLIGGNDE